MSLWSKILLGLIAVATLLCFYLATNALKAQQSWQTRVIAFEKLIDPVNAEVEQLEKGGERIRTQTLNIGGGRVNPNVEPQDRLGVAQWKILLDAALQLRGRAWYDVQPSGADPATGVVTVTVALPNPHHIAVDTILYAFDELPPSQGGAYLGEFRVTSVAEQTLTLKPTRKLSQRELDRLSSSGGEWTLYEKLPTDSRELFVGLTDDEISQLIPELSREPFLNDGKEAPANAPPEDVVEGKYVRPTLDFGISFAQLYASIAKTRDSIDALTNDVAKLDAALPALGNPALAGDDEQQTGALKAALVERKKLQAELATLQAEAEAVTKLSEALATKLADLKARSDRLLAENERLAAEITAAQRQAMGQ